MRFFLGLQDIVGWPSGIALGLRELGFQADLYTPVMNVFEHDSLGVDDNRFNKIFRMRGAGKGKLENFLIRVICYITKFVLLIYSLFKYDVFIFTGFGSFYNFKELLFLKLLNKKIVIVYYGSDSRPPLLSGIYKDDNDGKFDLDLIKLQTSKILRKLKRVEDFADYIVCHTASAQLFTRDFYPLLKMGVPPRNRRFILPKYYENKKVIKILHYPSRPNAKGTFQIRKAVKKVRKSLLGYGFRLQYLELQNVSNDVVLKNIKTADLVVNELYSDTFISAADMEAISLGVPSLKFGYYAQKILSDNGLTTSLDMLYFDPSELEVKILAYSLDAKLRHDAVISQQLFLEQCWSRNSVSTNIVNLINGNLDRELIAPNSIKYKLGWGLSEDEFQTNLKAFTEKYGKPYYV